MINQDPTAQRAKGLLAPVLSSCKHLSVVYLEALSISHWFIPMAVMWELLRASIVPATDVEESNADLITLLEEE